MGVGRGIDPRLQGREDGWNDEQKNKEMWREKRKQFKILKEKHEEAYLEIWE